MSRIASGIVGGAVVAGVGVGIAYGIWYLWNHGTAGPGFGFGKGGDSIWKTGGTTSPDDADGGASPIPGGGDDAGQGTSDDDKEDGKGKGGDSKGGDKPSDSKNGSKGDSGGDGGSGGDKQDGEGQGAGGGGVGGGSGGGVGSGEGEGTSDGVEDDGGSSGDQDGGGEGDGGKYDPWGGQLIDVDLDPPDLSPAKLDEATNVILELVGGAILDPGLPPPLHAFDPLLGGLLQFWTDVTLHKVWTLPPGRLDPDNASHVLWINLWLDILAEVSNVEKQINADFDDDIEDDNDVEFRSWQGLGSRSKSYQFLDVCALDRRCSRFRRDPLLAALFPRAETKHCCDACEFGLPCIDSCAA